MPNQIKRHIALKVTIKDLLDGQYIKGEGDWSPNYIEINDKQVSRANLLGVIVSRTEPSDLFLDDGSGKITIRSFDNKKIEAEIGDMVLVIGRPREFGNERYIVPEIVKKIEDKGWVELRKLQLMSHPKITQKNEITEEINEEHKPDQINIFDLIKKHDSGDGADMQDIIDASNTIESEKMIKSLLEAGEIFEIKPGRLKVLE